MNCLRPMTVKTPQGYITVPCRHCINCSVQKERYISLMSQFELLQQYKMGRTSSYITLTYNELEIPLSLSRGVFRPTLRHDDLQKYIKRVRKALSDKLDIQGVKVLYSGEYGDKDGRPHYHIIWYGVDSNLYNSLCRDKWQYGIQEVKPALSGAARYVSKYCMKQVYGGVKERLYTNVGMQAPFFYHSAHFGEQYILDNLDNDDLSSFVKRGANVLLPAQIRKKFGALLPLDKRYYSQIKAKELNLNYTEYVLKEAEKTAHETIVKFRQKQKPIDDSDYIANKKLLRSKSKEYYIKLAQSALEQAIKKDGQK